MECQNPFEVVGVGAPIVDRIVFVEEEFLSLFPGKKGGMELVTYDELSDIISKSGAKSLEVAGGSASNTIKGLANLGHRCSFVGKVGQDFFGDWVMKTLAEHGVVPQLVKGKVSLTSQVLCLVTPDGQRTMRSFIGASGELSPEDLNEEMFRGARLVHIEGYTLLRKNLTLRAMVIAKKIGAKVSFDLSSFELSKKYKSEIHHLLENYVDILFANEDEAKMMTRLPPDSGCKQLMRHCETVVVLEGVHGCHVGRSGRQIHYPAFASKPVDTTGAGDMFASGFLHGYLKGFTLEECAHMGSLLGAAAVHTVGAEIPDHIWKDVYTFRSKLRGAK